MNRFPTAKFRPSLFAWVASLTLVSFPTIQGQVLAEDDPSEWIRRMSDATNKLDYHGLFSYSDGTDTFSFRYVHAVRDGVRHERLVHSDGPYRELRRLGDDLFFFAIPGDRFLSDSSSTEPLTERLKGVVVPEIDAGSKHYRIVHLGEERVANRRATKIGLLPKENDRHGLELWLDKQSALVLRSRMINSQGETLEEIKFVRIRVGRVPEFALTVPRERSPASQGMAKRTIKSGTERAELHEEENHYSWYPEWVPAGFLIRSRKCRQGHEAARAPICTSIYSDGVASFSIVIDEGTMGLEHTVELQRGATLLATGSTLDEAGNGHLIAVVGEIPLETARKILKSISYRLL